MPRKKPVQAEVGAIAESPQPIAVPPPQSPAPSTAGELPKWAINIVRYDEAVDPHVLLAHPLNWRVHHEMQRGMFRAMVSKIGVIDHVKVSEKTGRIIDGHMRVSEAVAAGATVPVAYLNLSEAEERLALLLLNPLAEMAQMDGYKLHEVIKAIEGDGGNGDELIAEMTARGLFAQIGYDPAAFTEEALSSGLDDAIGDGPKKKEVPDISRKFVVYLQFEEEELFHRVLLALGGEDYYMSGNFGIVLGLPRMQSPHIDAYFEWLKEQANANPQGDNAAAPEPD